MKKVISGVSISTSLLVNGLLAVVLLFSLLPVGLQRVQASSVGSANVTPGPMYVLGEELISERTENAKKYFLGNNSYALDVSLGSIHYKDNYADASEPWKDIDLTFVNGRITNAPYILTVNQDDKSLVLLDKKTGKTASVRLTRIGNANIDQVEKRPAQVSARKVQWRDIAPDLDVAVTAANTWVSFDWVVKSENASHEVEFEVSDGGLSILYRGFDAEYNPVEVTTTRNGNRVTERIEKGGKYPKVINPVIEPTVGSGANDGHIRTSGSAYNPDWSRATQVYVVVEYYDTHRQWGTRILDSSTITGVWVYHTLHKDYTVPSYGATLYAPTVIPPNKSPLEVVSAYYYSSNTSSYQRQIAIFDHSTRNWVTIGGDDVDDYLSNGFYSTTIRYWDATGLWVAELYYYTGESWQVWAYQAPDRNNELFGWDVFEEYNFVESPWPSLGKTFVTYDLKVYVNSNWTSCNGTYGENQTYVDPIGYNKVYINDYYYWYVEDY